jgi:hypothetical protein
MENRPDQTTSTQASGSRTHLGSCHCGAVRFEADIDLQAGGGRCNCSVCTKIGPTSTIVAPGALRLLAGEEALAIYEWGPRISRRFFCSRCGVHVFGRGHLAELGGDYASVNLNTLDDIDPAEVTVTYWDGRHNNWEGGPRSSPWPLGLPAQAAA